MGQFELYDILKLDGEDIEYTILRRLSLDDREYFLLAEIEEDETPMLDELRILEYTSSGKLLEIEDVNLLADLGEFFTSALEADV